MTTWATPADVEHAANQWTEGQTNCRVYGHNWRPLQVSHRIGVYTIYQRCSRCHSERHQEVDERGYPLAGWQINYVEGYLLRKLGRVGTDGRAVLRLATIRNLYVVEEPVEEVSTG